MEASLLRRLSHSTASTSTAQQPLPVRCQRSHCAWGRSRQHDAHRLAVEHQRRCDPVLPSPPVLRVLSTSPQWYTLRPTRDPRAVRRRRDGSRWVLSAAGPAEPPEASAAASTAEQAEPSWERRTSNGAGAAEHQRGNAEGEDEADDDFRPEDWYNQLLEQGFSEVGRCAGPPRTHMCAPAIGGSSPCTTWHRSPSCEGAGAARRSARVRMAVSGSSCKLTYSSSCLQSL